MSKPMIVDTASVKVRPVIISANSAAVIGIEPSAGTGRVVPSSRPAEIASR